MSVLHKYNSCPVHFLLVNKIDSQAKEQIPFSCLSPDAFFVQCFSSARNVILFPSLKAGNLSHASKSRDKIYPVHRTEQTTRSFKRFVQNTNLFTNTTNTNQ